MPNKQLAPTLAFSTLTGLIVFLILACSSQSGPSMEPVGGKKRAKTKALKAGGAAVQSDNPLKPFNLYLVGFHPLKDDPSLQVEAHHFCRQVNEDFMQCTLFDANTEEANLTGIEYIISEKLFESLPEPERKYWHPHNYEILSGHLVAPGIPDAVEKELMRGKMNSYGKTWHVWKTGNGEVAGDPLPLGDSMLAWSFNRDGELEPGLAERRDSLMGTNTQQIRSNRQDLIPVARPQWGVDVLQDAFPRGTRPLPGVVEQSRRTQTK